jgi:transcriptional regulator with XRE-family HTH domain
MAEPKGFGEFFKAKRIALGVTLRQFCQKHGLDPGNLSKIERGLLPPPKNRKKLEEYAGYLGLKKGSDDWIEFFDRAAAEAGRIPADILSDEEVVDKLPILFRTLRGQKVPEDKLNELVRKIKGK